MSIKPNVVIVLSRCRRSRQPYGMRFEEKGRGNWLADWAFAIKEQSAKREGFDRGEISGAFGFATTYPGCPSCKAPGLFRCGCGKVACWGGVTRTVQCPWCGRTVNLDATVDRLGAGGDG